jgi:tRNA nucleotidyltransferase (CCA-adding enzyme)
VEKLENKPLSHVPGEVSRITHRLQEAGYEAYLVGGCARDILLGKKPKDWDVTTNATPEEIIRLFEHTFYENSFGTVGVVNEGVVDPTLEVIEVTTYRLESGYSDSRHPDTVSFSTRLEDDLKRRDFTINAIALSLPIGEKDIYKGQIVDPYKGQDDLAAHTVRTVENPIERFGEDALRILRAIRIAAELGFTIDIDTAQGIRETSASLKNIAQERIRDEFIKILMSPRPMEALQIAHALGVLQYVIRETEEGIGVKQNKAHSFDVWEHSLRTLQHAADKNWPLHIRLTTLFHDVGKPATRRWAPEKKEWTFHGHEVVGSRMAKEILNRLRFSRETVDLVVKLVRWHMFFSDTEQITHSAVRRMIQNVGQEHVWDLMNVRVCDRVGTGRPKENPYRLRKYRSMIEEVLRDPVSVGMLKIDGKRVMDVSRITPGPKIGWILHALLEEVIEDPKLNIESYLEARTIELAALPEVELMKLGEKAKERKEKEDEKGVREIRKRHWVE